MTGNPTIFRTNLRKVLALGLPLAGSHLAQFMLAVTDTIMLGWYGVVDLAAGVLGAALFFAVFTFGSGFANAVMPMVATAASSGQETEVRRATRMGLWLSIAFGLVALPLFWFSGTILTGLGQPEDVIPLAEAYMRLLGFSLVPALIVMVLKNYLAALGRTQVAFWITVGAVFLNVGLNWMFIFGNFGMPEMGVRGAAIATIVVNLATAGALALYCALQPALKRYTLFQRFWRPDWQAMGQVWRLGWPIGVALVAETALFSAATVMVGWIGTHELAAHGIALEITAMLFMVHLGFSNAATVLVGRARGQRDQDALRMGAKVAVAVSMAFATATMVLYIAAGPFLVGLFLSPDEPARAAIIAIGASFLIVAAVFQLADGAQVMAMGLLRGVQDTRGPMLIAAFSYWGVGLPTSYLFGIMFGWGGEGVWAGLVVGLSVAALLLMLRFWRGPGRADARPWAK
ncbi:MATE family efflux transporter [Roseinatronobacter bogoriensis]|uniref:Multidrug-efflux transporter n=1 Tax=Roseinatronobacter bogoriensis subsp. barguzinensis TaxID=441209 RepID=A0A2K8KCM6_9RHOB|nr:MULTISPECIES: MATE family efflux transporter [Rhodobaca]ATX67197.1 MATE family efflux transporter [Rhodobaca barguzinensis]MBB4206734.1 MATE family multidrug resistance protein [Rhodobaca bogoriensis DSM 18756]TDW41478.1 MATE family multidrug resistance protein [Rhodobaca barguzinensis]TDY74344.1 MATE family multidrug resistance protein [Rhodobaca bogoriensis DSM 18756]